MAAGSESPSLTASLAEIDRLHRAGDRAGAEALCRRLLEQDPRRPAVLGRLGLIHAADGRIDSAEALMRRALTLDPDDPDGLCRLGGLLFGLGRLDEAVRLYRTAERLAPGGVQAPYGLALALGGQGDLDGALLAVERALNAHPAFLEGWLTRARLAEQTGDFEQGLAAAREAVRLNPRSAEGWRLIGIMLTEQGAVDEALTALDRALALDPTSALIERARGVAFARAWRLEPAWAAFDRAVRLDPSDVASLVNRGIARISQGRLAEGWADYERRFEIMPQGLILRHPGAPRWFGEPLAGRRLLVVAEQGIGDTIHFLRYIPMLAARAAAEGARVSVAVQDPIRRLAAGLEPLVGIIARGDPLPAFDLYCPLLSLAAIFGTTMETIPPPGWPGFGPDPRATQRWAGLQRNGSLNIGLVWAGDPRPHSRSANTLDRRRSIRLIDLAPLARLEGATFFSLQKGPAAAEAETPPPGLTLIDVMDRMQDFQDTAALTAQLDLVLTVDTAMAHLAGTLGVPTWVMSRLDACWRWHEGRDDSPWYPTIRLFRQTRPGDWAGVIDRVTAALEQVLAGGRGGG